MEVIGTVYCYKGRTNPILAPNSRRATIYKIQNHFHLTKSSDSMKLTYNLFKVWVSIFFQVSLTFHIESITFHLSIIQSKINLFKLTNSFQGKCSVYWKWKWHNIWISRLVWYLSFSRNKSINVLHCVPTITNTSPRPISTQNFDLLDKSTIWSAQIKRF